MFQIAHTYIASQALDTEDPHIIVGAIIPDASISGWRTYISAVLNPQPTDTSGITFQDMHPVLRARSLARHINKNVALGVLTHSAVDVISHGGDDISRDKYDWRNPKAFSFGGERSWWARRFPKLEPKNYSRGMMMHNFAEVMLDCYVAQTHPEAATLLENSIKHVDAARIGADLATALGKNSEVIIAKVNAYLASTSGFVRMIRRAPRVNKDSLDEVLGNCIQTCESQAPEWYKLIKTSA